MRTPDQKEAAETLALNALAFLAESPDGLARFVAASGLSPESLRERAAEPDFLGAVLDFLLADDELLIAFCELQSLEPRFVHSARRILSGD
ncbi:MAG TPA: DUF3572 domain-containing protein [Rhizomicrobium sp.]|jgi:hypothetical protein